MLDFDTMLEHVGAFGKYQKILFFFQAPFAFFLSFSLFGQLFIILFPDDYWCSSAQTPGFNETQRLSITSPADNRCLRFVVNPSNVDEFLAYLNTEGVCNPTANCISCNCNPGRNKRQETQYDKNGWGRPFRYTAFPRAGYTPTPSISIGTLGPGRESGNIPRTNRPVNPVTTPSSRTAVGRTEASRASCPVTPNFENCRMDPAASVNTGVPPSNKPNGWETENCESEWSYNTTTFEYKTILTQGRYWCEYLPSLSLDEKLTISQSIFYIGAILGGFGIGYVADNFGRVPALVAANILGCIGGVLTVSTTNFFWFCVFRFIAGMSFDNCFTMIYILVLEYVGASYRTVVANLSIAIFYTLGTVSIPGLFWLIKDWRWFGLVTSLPMLLSLLAIFVVPESARWLVSKGRIKEASNILRSFGKINGNTVDEKLYEEFEETGKLMFEELSKEKPVSLLEAMKRPKILKNFILLVIIWSLIALMYDGHSRNVLNLGNNVVVMFAIASSLELPADLVVVFFLDIVGRRLLAFSALFLAAVFSLVSAVPSIAAVNSTLLVFAMISRFFINIAFNIGMQYAAELLPTVIRAQGVNVIHIMGYVASIISPFIASIGRTNVSLSLTILGCCSLVAAVLALFLPETLGEDLPNTLDDGEGFGKHQSFWTFPLCSKPKPPEQQHIVPESTPESALRRHMNVSLRGEGFRSSLIVRHSILQKPVQFNPNSHNPGQEQMKLRRVYTVR